MKKIAVLLMLCAALLLSACGGAVRSSAPTPTPEPLPARDGFDPETNHAFSTEVLEFLIPQYFNYSQDQSNDTVAVFTASSLGAEEAVLMLTSVSGQFSPEEFDAAKSNLLTKYLENSSIKRSTETKALTLPAGDAAYCNISFSNAAISANGAAVVIHVPDRGICFCTLLQTKNSVFDYYSDFNQILTSAVPSTEKSPVPSAEPTEAPASGTVTPELKKFLDEYEAFIDEYVKFMKSYSSGNVSTSMMMKYLNLLSKYSDFTNTLNGINEKELSGADYA